MALFRKSMQERQHRSGEHIGQWHDLGSECSGSSFSFPSPFPPFPASRKWLQLMGEGGRNCKTGWETVRGKFKMKIT